MSCTIYHLRAARYIVRIHNNHCICCHYFVSVDTSRDNKNNLSDTLLVCLAIVYFWSFHPFCLSQNTTHLPTEAPLGAQIGPTHY